MPKTMSMPVAASSNEPSETPNLKAQFQQKPPAEGGGVVCTSVVVVCTGVVVVICRDISWRGTYIYRARADHSSDFETMANADESVHAANAMAHRAAAHTMNRRGIMLAAGDSCTTT